MACVGFATSAFGQEEMPAVAESPDTRMTTPLDSESGGIRLSDDTILHPNVELASGYQTNVFYREDNSTSGAPGAGIVRISGGMAIVPVKPPSGDGQAAQPEAAGARLDFSGNMNLTWNQYVAPEDGNDIAGDLGIGLIAQVGVNPQNPLSFAVRDSFTRVVNPPRLVNAETLDRDKNEAVLTMTYKPGGGAFQFYGTFSWMIDLFERSSSALPNRTSYIGAGGFRWQWLPMTQFNFEMSYGVVTILEDSTKTAMGTTMAEKPTSTPLRANFGVSTLITPTFGVVIKGGYGNGFYDTGPNYNSYLAQVEGRYSLSSTSRVAFGYEREFSDSVTANFYQDHGFYGKIGTLLAGRLQLRSKLDMRLRTYEGVIAVSTGGKTFEPSSSTRNDFVVRLDAGAEYQISPMLVAGIDYVMSANNTEFFMLDPVQEAMDGRGEDPAKFLWQEIMVRISGKY
jgi:hypothetical protein